MIRALSVIGHGINILPHFLKHYSEYVDEIHLVVYESDIQKNLHDEVSKIIIDYPKSKIVKKIYDRVFDFEKVTMLYNYVKSTHPFDWWVIADIDEFHLYPLWQYPNDKTSYERMKMMINDLDSNGWEIVRGGFIDRIGPDGEFSELKNDVNIFKQYPNMGFFRYPMSKACPNKICLVKGHIEITFGQHYAKIDGHTTWRWQGWNHPLIAPIQTYSVQVHHFKWDATSIERIKSVANNKQSYSYSDEYQLMYDRLRKSRFKIDLNNKEFMFENESDIGVGHFLNYKEWNKLIKKIISI
jgi:hypothetical protein